MAPVSLDYNLLLGLFRGGETAVERIPPEKHSDVEISTPLTAFIRSADEAGRPAHVVLTGNAGDGKTFAAVGAKVANMELIMDASRQLRAGSQNPLADMAAHIESLLRDGRRLLMAINRGQMERIVQEVTDGDYPLATSFFESVRDQLTLHVTPRSTSDSVATIDLGLLDTLSDAVLDAFCEKLGQAEISGNLSDETRLIVGSAQEAMMSVAVQKFLKSTLRRARANGAHITMRHLWSIFAYLITGGRSPDARDAPNIRDSLGARLFAESANVPLPRDSRIGDPARLPQPFAARAFLGDAWQEHVADLPGLRNLARLPSENAGRALIRAWATHGALGASRSPINADPTPVERYDDVITRLLQQPGQWQSFPQVSSRILSGIYNALGLWHSDRTFPAWTRLCYDAVRLPRAGAAATAEIRDHDLRLAIPLPPQHTLSALDGSWRPPHVLLGFGDSGRHAVRLGPRLFRRLHDQPSGTERLDPTELLLLQRWLSGAPAESSQRDEAHPLIRVADASKRALALEPDEFEGGRLALRWEAESA